jgi:Spy/CpxP family protein refolding chaperone
MTPQQEEWIKEKTKEIGRLWFSEVRLRSAIEAALRAAIEQQQGKEDETPQPTGNFIVDLAKWAALLTKKNEQLSAAEAKVKELEAQLIDIDNLRMSADRRVAELEGKERQIAQDAFKAGVQRCNWECSEFKDYTDHPEPPSLPTYLSQFKGQADTTQK